jgi:hypothetical protein
MGHLCAKGVGFAETVCCESNGFSGYGRHDYLKKFRAWLRLSRKGSGVFEVMVTQSDW